MKLILETLQDTSIMITVVLIKNIKKHDIERKVVHFKNTKVLVMSRDYKNINLQVFLKNLLIGILLYVRSGHSQRIWNLITLIRFI